MANYAGKLKGLRCFPTRKKDEFQVAAAGGAQKFLHFRSLGKMRKVNKLQISACGEQIFLCKSERSDEETPRRLKLTVEGMVETRERWMDVEGNFEVWGFLF
jgi:hypothetical protein